VLILYVTLIGAAVGVRDAGHIGMDSILVLVPEEPRRIVEMVVHVLVLVFGGFMVWKRLGARHVGRARTSSPTSASPRAGATCRWCSRAR
jgi:TRAP-type C4-dicarboxylate transport system permease small subunit